MPNDNNDNKRLVLEELRNICENPLFSEHLCKIITYLVNETLAGRAESIKAYGIATEALGRRGDFDPGTDSIVRSQMYRLRSKLKDYYAGPGSASKIVIDIPVNSYIPLFSARVNEKTFDKDVTQSKKRWRPSIIVLPFTNNTPEDEYGFFSHGLAEQVSIALSKFQDIEVISIHASSETITRDSVHEVAKKLNCRFLLEGSYCVLDKVARIYVRLSDIKNASILWAETMDFSLESSNYFSLEDKILENILTRIAGDYGKISRYLLYEASDKDSEDLEIYEVILRYYSYTGKITFPLFLETRAALEHCLDNCKKRCPALLYAALGELYLADYKLGFDTVTDSVEKADFLINHALEIDYTLQGAHLARANLSFVYRNKEDLDKYIEQTININPNNYSSVSACYSWYARSGNWQEGCDKLKKIYKNTHSIIPSWHYLPFVMLCYKNGNYEKALEFCNKYKTNDHIGMSDYYSLAINDKLNKVSGVENAIEKIRNSPLDRKGKMDRVFRCQTFDDELCDDLIDVLKKYDIA